MSGFFDAVSLLTRFPTRAGADRQRALPWFPVVGALIGLLVAGVYIATRTLLGPTVAAVLAIGAGVLATGGLHEDGLADTVDAFGAGGDRARTLEILQDPRHGTYGVLALIGTVLIRVGALATLRPWAAFAVLPAAHALSRAGSLGLIAVGRPAGTSGLGSSYAAGRDRAIGVGCVAALVIAALGLGWWALVAVGIVVLVVFGMRLGSQRKIGGFTGDVLGAVQQLSEIGILLLSSAAARAIPWWHH